MPRRFPVIPLVLACLVPAIATAGESATGDPRIGFEWNLRLRSEHVDDDAFTRNADATTLRVRAGMRFRLGGGFGALVEGEGIATAGEGYNNSANGRSGYPLIADVEGAELNQGWLAWKNERLQATAGRQRLLFDNQRWIGNVGWRQNEQTFDALSIDGTLRPGITARYAWLDRVHRVNGDDAIDPLARERDLDSHLLELAWRRGVHQLAGYAWLHDDQDVATASTATFGIRSTTSTVRDGHGWGLSLELARQHDYADNPLDFSHGYWLVEPSLTRRGVTWRAGWEHLGGNGNHALQTPLATLHAFNGWADKFATTPAGGLEDRYVGAGGKLAANRLDWQVAWHDYRADAGGRYGSEWNASLGFPLGGPLKGLVKLADYRADGFARDTTKAWVQVEWMH